jgi:magnesium-transporting ATPase (P-type)
MEAQHRDIAWIEGASILLAVVIIVLVTVLNNMKKDKEFHKLNELAECGKKITIVRGGSKNEEGRIQEVVVGDLIMLKQGMEVAGDGIVLEGYTLQLDESSMTGETKPMNKDSLEKCVRKMEECQQMHKEIGLHDLPSPVILSGTRVLNGSGRMIVINVGPNSSIGKIQQLISSGEEELTPL